MHSYNNPTVYSIHLSMLIYKYKQLHIKIVHNFITFQKLFIYNTLSVHLYLKL